MTRIKMLVDRIDEELKDARDYAEMSLECKAKGNNVRYSDYKKMSNDELEHAMIVHRIAVEEIEALKRVYQAPVEMQDLWDRQHKIYVEQVAWIKQMLAL